MFNLWTLIYKMRPNSISGESVFIEVFSSKECFPLLFLGDLLQVILLNFLRIFKQSLAQVTPRPEFVNFYILNLK